MSFRFVSGASGRFQFMRLQRYSHISRYVFYICVTHNPFSCSGEKEAALPISIDISIDIVIVFAEGIAYFAPIFVMIGAIFIDNRFIIIRFQPQFYNVNILINRKLNQHFLICAVYNLESSIGR